MVMSEFGAGALHGYHGDALTRWSEEYQIDVYEKNLEMISNIVTPWLLMDFILPEGPCVTYKTIIIGKD